MAGTAAVGRPGQDFQRRSVHEPIKRLPKLTSASKTSTLKPLLGIVVLAIVGALTTVGLLRLVPYLLRW